MTHPMLELQSAIHAVLSADAELTALVGAGRIFDHVPNNAKPPFAAIGTTEMVDYGTSTEESAEHLVTIHVWSARSSRSDCYRAQEIVHELITGMATALGTHVIANAHLDFSDVRRDQESRFFTALSRFRIVTEAL